jgi:RNA polymerase sigma-70 factor (ECF subfamily)
MQTLNDIWTEMGARLRQFVGRRVNDPHAADDITQEVMLKVQTQLNALPPQDRLPAWMFTIARNAVIDHYRARSLREPVELPVLEAAHDSKEIDRQEQVRGLSECLVRVVEHLPEPYRHAMKLADLDGVTQQEIADRAGISLSGAKSRVQRARQQLREMLLDCCHVERDGRGNVITYQPTARSSHYCGDADRPRCGC